MYVLYILTSNFVLFMVYTSAPKMTCGDGPYKETILINERQSLAANQMCKDEEKLLMKKSRQPMMFLTSVFVP